MGNFILKVAPSITPFQMKKEPQHMYFGSMYMHKRLQNDTNNLKLGALHLLRVHGVNNNI